MRFAHVARTAVLVAALIGVTASAHAVPVLLASLTSTGSLGSTALATDGQAFTLWYLADPSACAGCGVIRPLGSTGTFDFDATNDPQFGALVAHLTNGVDEFLMLGTEFYIGASFTGGSASGTLESLSLSFTPDLAGHTIDFVRVEVLSNVISPTVILGFPGVQSDFTERWTIFGDDPVSVPEPATATLLAMGLLASARRKRPSSPPS